MIENTLKRLLKSGDTAIGTMVCDSRSPAIARALAVAGFDFFILDAEHGSYSFETISDIMVMARQAGITPIVRIPDCAYPFVARTMDAGALGVMVPRVKSRREVEQVVRAVKYPPMGERGMSNARANTDFLPISIRDYVQWANEQTMVVVQVETKEAVEAIDDILAIPGVDAALMGPADLSMSLGVMDPSHPKVAEGIQRTLDGATRRGLACGTHTLSLEDLKAWRNKGMRLLMYHYDFGLIMSGAEAAIKELRS